MSELSLEMKLRKEQTGESFPLSYCDLYAAQKGYLCEETEVFDT
jgi:hypothetical protein